MSRTAALLAAFMGRVAGTGLAEPASGQERRFHFGIGVPVETPGVTYEKAVDNTDPGTLVPARAAARYSRKKVPQAVRSPGSRYWPVTGGHWAARACS